MLMLLSNIRICLRICLISVPTSSRMMTVLFAIYFVNNQFRSQLIISIASVQNQVESLLSMSNEFFIYANIFQHYSIIPFSLYIYGVVYPIFIPCFWQKLQKKMLINSPPPSVYRQLSLLPQASAFKSQSLNVSRNLSLLLNRRAITNR